MRSARKAPKLRAAATMRAHGVPLPLVTGRQERSKASDLPAGDAWANVRRSMPGDATRFCRGELGMWYWLWSDDTTGLTFVSREGFSNIKDCEKDAQRHRKVRATLLRSDQA